MNTPALLRKGPVLLDERKVAPTDTLEKMIQEYQASENVEPCFQECLDGVNCDYPNCKSPGNKR